MKLCVGATSRLVVEETAKLKIPQIVASRRQVDEHGGYIGMTPAELVEVAHRLSDGETKVIRDHGGPFQNGDPNDDWVRAFDIDVEAGFDGLHIDVIKLPREEQQAELRRLIERYADNVNTIEVGGERDEQGWLQLLVDTALAADLVPDYAVLDLGGHAWADRQQGMFRSVEWVAGVTERYHRHGIKTKAHNADWYGGMHKYDDVLDSFNVAPEFGVIETDAWLRALPFDRMQKLLNEAYASNRWTRWFGPGEGSIFERARCALRYIWDDVADPEWTGSDMERYVRHEVSNALATR